MAGRSIDEILSAKVIMKAVSQIAVPGTSLQRLFGWNIGGGNMLPDNPRHGAYDTFDHTRQVANGRTPGSPLNRVKPQKTGTVSYTLPRAAERITLQDEQIINRRVIGGPVNELDSRGERYILRQETYLAERFSNLIEFQTAAMLRGSYTFDQEGDELRHRFSGGDITINYQLPANNKSQLNGNISAAWDNAGTDIPLDCFNVNNYSLQLTGMPIEHAIVSSTVWNFIVNNTKVHTQGGSANLVFDEITRTGAGEFSAVLRSIPWLTFHIIDYGLDVWDGSNFTYTKLIPDDVCIFLPTPNSNWTEYLQGGEMVTEGPNGVREMRNGFYPYAYPEHDPSGWNLCAVHNGLPAIYNPQAWFYATVDY